jgi:hypothetical protein
MLFNLQNKENYSTRKSDCQQYIVRCPGDTIHFMRFEYQEYVDRLVELAGIKPRTEWTGYDSWNPYRLQDPEKREP